MMRTYSELIKIPTFNERYEYLKLSGVINEAWKDLYTSYESDHDRGYSQSITEAA